MNCILHLGLPKTATTSLQRDFFNRLPGIALSLRETPGPAAILENIRYRTSDATELSDGETGYLNKVRQKFQRALPNDPQFHASLVSNENIIGPHPDGPQVLIRRIKAVCPGAKIIITLRDPMDFLKSIYRQELENYISTFPTEVSDPPNIVSFNSFVRKILRDGPRGHLAYIHHDEIRNTLHECFGPENVLVLDFELLKKSEIRFLNTILEFIGSPVRALLGIARENPSASKIDSLLEMARRKSLSTAVTEKLTDIYNDFELTPDAAMNLSSYISRHAGSVLRDINRSF